MPFVDPDEPLGVGVGEGVEVGVRMGAAAEDLSLEDDKGMEALLQAMKRFGAKSNPMSNHKRSLTKYLHPLNKTSKPCKNI